MCYVNYVRENIAFMEYASDERLSASEQLLWHALIHLMNQRANGSDWPEGFVSIPNARILFYAPFGEDTLTSARNRLKQRGLIDYIPGKKNKQAPQYKMVYFSAELSTCNEQNVGSFTEISGNVQGNARGNVQGNARGNVQGNSYGFNVNLYENPNRNPNAYDDDDHEEEEISHAREVMGRIVEDAYLRCIGRAPVPIERQQLITVALDCSMLPDMAEQAIGRAALRNAKSPALYAMELMRDWEYHKVHTMDDLVEYEHKRM